MTATSGATASLLPVQAACSTCDRARAGVRARGGVRVGVRVTVRLRVRVRVRVRFRVRVRVRVTSEREKLDDALRPRRPLEQAAWLGVGVGQGL